MKSEFEFIENIRARSSLSKIGDDCAVLRKDSKTDLVITTDLLVEDIDFRLDWAVPELLGHKSLAVSLSDIAAMGAKPVWAMLSIGIPAQIWETSFVKNFYQGWFALAKKFKVELIGGDVSKTPDKIVIDSIVAGEVERGKAILRSGAEPGDLLFVTGKLGGAAGGLHLLENGVRYDSKAIAWQKNLMLKQLRPIPNITDGLFLREKFLATSMIDLSDGISGDLTHICRESRVGSRIFASKIPQFKNLCPFADSFEKKLELALNGGEDFELLFTVNPKKFANKKNEFSERGYFEIGEMTAHREVIELISDGNSKILESESFRHF